MNIFSRTLNRLFGNISIFNPVVWFPALLDGISEEFKRVRDFKNQVLLSTVPSKNMPDFSVEDYENKYGIYGFSGTMFERKCRIIERADLNGLPSASWLQRQVRNAGFNLYVVENLPQSTNVLRWGDFQYGPTIQWGITSRFIDITTIPGFLIVNSPFTGQGKAYLTQWGNFQFGPDLQWGTPDLSKTTPIAKEYEKTTDPAHFGAYFFLSPVEGSPVTDTNDFLDVTQNEYNYLRKLIIGSKPMKNWCIAQVNII